jgi:hypothetical protein
LCIRVGGVVFGAADACVHIDTDEVHHTPQLVYVRDESAGQVPLVVEGQGLQYILQIGRRALGRRSRG